MSVPISRPGVLQHALGDAVVGVRLGRGDDGQALELLRVGDRLEVLRDAEIVRALHDGADHDAGAARLARHLRHGRVADREIGRAAEHGGEGLGVAAGRGDVHLEAVLLEDAGVHADIEIDVAEIVHGLAEVDLLQVLRRRRSRRDGEAERERNRPERPAGVVCGQHVCLSSLIAHPCCECLAGAMPDRPLLARARLVGCNFGASVPPNVGASQRAPINARRYRARLGGAGSASTSPRSRKSSSASE